MLTRATVVPLPVRMTFSHSLQSPCVESQVNSYLGDFAAAEEKVLRCSSGLFGWVQTELAFAAADVECEVGRARKRRPQGRMSGSSGSSGCVPSVPVAHSMHYPTSRSIVSKPWRIMYIYIYIHTYIYYIIYSIFEASIELKNKESR